MSISIGIDDTDSARRGMCTTYVATMVVETLDTIPGLVFRDFPCLVRLNPQVPNKTRGNGALALHLWAEPGSEDEIFDTVCHLVSEHSVLEDPSTHPGIAMGAGDPPDILREYYNSCLHRIVTRREALEMAELAGLRTMGMKEGLGVIGAVAALGADFNRDQTFEIIAYRDPGDRGRERGIDEDLVLRLDREVSETFYNYDYMNHKVCVVPASPCPVLFGVRGETPGAVVRGYNILRGEESPPATLFRTNQHTDAHLERAAKIASLRPRSSYIVKGTVHGTPRSIPGGHVIFTLSDGSGQIDCAAYEPTKQFRGPVGKLRPGDLVRVYGSVRPADSRHGMTLNLEKVEIISLVDSVDTNPTCPRCGSRMESMGKGSGFRCRDRSCGFRDRTAGKVKLPIPRELAKGFYEPPPVAWRHLYRPLLRGAG